MGREQDEGEGTARHRLGHDVAQSITGASNAITLPALTIIIAASFQGKHAAKLTSSQNPNRGGWSDGRRHRIGRKGHAANALG